MMRATLDSAPPASDDLEDSQQEWQESTEDNTDPQYDYDYTDDGQKPSKWEKFVASTDKTDDNQDPSDSEDPQFTTDKNRFQQRKRKGKGQSLQGRQGKRQRCQGAIPDVPARPSFVQTCATDWQLPTTQQENSPTFHEQRGYSNMNTSHNLWHRHQHHENIGGNTEPPPTAVHTTWQQKVHATNLTRKIQNQDFTEGNTERESTAQPRWQQHSHTTNMTHSKVALSETSKIKLEEREEVKFRNEESWKDVDKNNDDRSVDRQMPNLARQEQKGKRSITSSSGSSSRWSRFTSKTVDDDDDDDEAQQVHVESYGSNRPNDSSSSKCDILSARFTANEGNVEQDRKEVLSYYSDDPAIEKCHHPMMAKPSIDPQGDLKTRMTGDVQNCGEVSELRTGFCTGEDLDQVLGDDIWDL